MTPTIKNKFLQMLNIGLFAISIGSANAALTDLGDAPLVSATTGDVLPNLMYILDNSGSMSWNYMPDYVNDANKCKSNTSTSLTVTAFSSSCGYGDPPYNTTDFNTVYYNPDITYTPAVNSDGSPRTSMTSANTAGWTAVPIDAFGVYSTSNASLVPNAGFTSGFPDKVWCNKTSGITTADLYDPLVCKKNSQYIYPSTVSGNQALSFNQSATAYGYPFYYTVSAGKYCTNKNFTNCIDSLTPTATHTFPAKLLWCNSSARTNCKSKYDETTSPKYDFALWTGISTSTVGKIKIKPDTVGCGSGALPSCVSPAPMTISNITINGIRIIPLIPSPALTITNTTSVTERNDLARDIRDAINDFVPAGADPDFTATVIGDEVTIRPVAPGAFTGTIALTQATPKPTAVGTGTAAVGSFRVDIVNSGTTTLAGITVNGVQIMGGAGAGCGTASSTSTGNNSARRNAHANAIVARINSCVSSPEYTASSNGASQPTITITSTVAAGAAGNGAIVLGTRTNGSSFGSIVNASGGAAGAVKIYDIANTIAQFSGGTPVVTTFERVDIEPGLTFNKAAGRTDCAAASCTYDEEMTNFANWYSYYRTRMQMMKTSTSLAFKSIDTRFRVGFITISNQSSNYLPIAQYTAGQKANWYDKLFATGGNSGTPLRSALTTVGRIYAGKNPVSGFTADPVQFSCQQNFAILTTDGYWNTDSDSNVVNIAGTGSVGNVDGGTTPRPMYEGTTATSNSLADAAKYYYDTDLRTSTLSNCTGGTRPNGTTGDVCENNVFVTPSDNNLKQHMTTFTLGLGVDASLTYTTDYKTAEEGDFYELKQGTRNWPVAAANSQTAVDDLWHAAVNGQGTYFSAKNPNQLASSLTEALSSIKAKVGAGAAAATSTLNPVSGDNFTYVASYTSVKWIGNLEARTVNIDTGKVSEDANWCLENVVADSCAAPSSVVASTVGGSTVYQCVTPGATATTCTSPGVLDGTDCKVEISTSCIGTLQSLVTDDADTRNILMNVNGAIGNFTAANLILTGKNTNFENSFLSTNLNQWSTLSAAQRLLVNSTTLVNFLRGNTGYEDRASNVDGAVDSRIYRFRETTLGDLVDSTPVYVGVPKANFSDPGYGPNTSISSFKAAQATRAGTVYIGANDGMIHAIDATNGQERWAYVPSMVLDNMWKLASNNYGSAHSYYVNGDIVVNDICTASCTSATTAVWRTILVGGLNGGGKGYFALDITNPTTPTLLWEFDTTDDGDMGYSYGNPVITKKADGTWVALVTSGYNNTGVGYMYVLNATTGAVISKYSTGVGSATTPSGLAKINAYIEDGVINNTAVFVYGGDLLGNLWRFDINSAESATNPFKVAVLKDPSGNPQPITVRPELADISGKRVLYVGTGRYLGTSDLTDTQQQTIYAISDDAASTPTTLDNPRTSSAMVKQVLVNDTLTATRSMQTPSNPVSFTTDRGWYIDFPDSGERQNVPAQLVFGTLLLPTTVPSNTVCSPGGYGWLNFLDYRTGAAVAGNVVASRTNAPIVGINVLYVKGKPVVNIVTADNPTPSFPPVQPNFTGGSQSGFTNHRVIWRELIDEQQ